MLERERGDRQFARIISRLSNRFTTGETIREAVDKVVLKKLLQTLPRQEATRLSIWDKEPKTSKEAARLAFQDRNVDLDDPRDEMTKITGGVTETSLGATTMSIWRDTQNDSIEEGDTKMINHSRKNMEAMQRRMPESGTETRTHGGHTK